MRSDGDCEEASYARIATRGALQVFAGSGKRWHRTNLRRKQRLCAGNNDRTRFDGFSVRVGMSCCCGDVLYLRGVRIASMQKFVDCVVCWRPSRQGNAQTSTPAASHPSPQLSRIFAAHPSRLTAQDIHVRHSSTAALAIPHHTHCTKRRDVAGVLAIPHAHRKLPHRQEVVSEPPKTLRMKSKPARPRSSYTRLFMVATSGDRA